MVASGGGCDTPEYGSEVVACCANAAPETASVAASAAWVHPLRSFVISTSFFTFHLHCPGSDRRSARTSPSTNQVRYMFRHRNPRAVAFRGPSLAQNPKKDRCKAANFLVSISSPVSSVVQLSALNHCASAPANHKRYHSWHLLRRSGPPSAEGRSLLEFRREP